MTIVESTNVHLEEYLDLQKYWLVLKRRWLPATAIFASTVGIATIGSLFLPEIYEAQAELLIKSDANIELTDLKNEVGKIDGLTYKSDPVTTQARILQSRPIIKQLIVELDLQNEAGELLKYQDVIPGLKVQPITGTDLLQVSYTSADAEEAALIANKIVELYIERDTLNNRSQSSSAREFIERQLPNVEANVRKAEANLRDFKNTNRIANLDEETTANINSTSNINDRLNQLKAELKNVDARYNRLSHQLNISWQEASVVSALSESIAIQKVLEELQSTKVRLAQKRNYLSDNNPEIIALKAEEADLIILLEQQIASTLGEQKQNSVENINLLSLGELKQAQIAEFAELGLRKEGLEKEISSLENTYNSYQQKSDILPKLQEQQRELERRVEAAQSTYQTLLKRLQDIQIIEQQNIGNIRIVSQADIPEEAIGPRKKLIVAGAGILGILLGITVAFLLDILDKTIKNTLEIKKIFAYPIKGVIPDWNKTKVKKQLFLPDSSTANLPQIVANHLSLLPVREVYQTILTDLELANYKVTQKIIMVSSANSGEGKSTFAANLAIAQAQCGKRTLLVDGDLRCSTQHKLWGVSNDLGLTDVLKQEIDWHDVSRHLISNLDLITSGTINENVVALLNSNIMKIFIDDIASYYDCIIFDSPPLIGLADSKILGKFVDGLLFIIRPGVANYSSITAAKELLTDTQFNVLGIVANGVDLNQEPFGHEYYYGDKKYLEAVS